MRWLAPSELKPSGERFNSPYDPKACYATKRKTEWIGYKVHVTETCEADAPPIVTHVETTASVQQDVSTTKDIQQALADKDCLPDTHLVDAGYVDADLLASSQIGYGIKLVGPVRDNPSWQAKAKQGFSLEDFTLDWDKQQAICPQGKRSYPWKAFVNKCGTTIIQASFRPKGCQVCPLKSLCTNAKTTGRMLGFQPRDAQEAFDAMKTLMASDEGKALYRQRAGIEGSLSQGVRKMGLRYTRYRGLQKTRLQHLATAAAINVSRVVSWLRGDLPISSRTSPFARLAPQS